MDDNDDFDLLLQLAEEDDQATDPALPSLLIEDEEKRLEAAYGRDNLRQHLNGQADQPIPSMSEAFAHIPPAGASHEGRCGDSIRLKQGPCIFRAADAYTEARSSPFKSVAEKHRLDGSGSSELSVPSWKAPLQPQMLHQGAARSSLLSLGGASATRPNHALPSSQGGGGVACYKEALSGLRVRFNTPCLLPSGKIQF